MRIKCTECHRKAVISSRNELDPKVADLYCLCTNPECGASFVMKLSYSHTLSPPRRQVHSMAVELLRGLPPAEQLELLQQARAAS